MVDETPRKKKNRGRSSHLLHVFIGMPWQREDVYFRKQYSHDFSQIIKSALNIDVSCCNRDSTNGALFICKSSCYKRLLKFERATEKVEEVRKEIQAVFQARSRAERLLHPTSGDEDEIHILSSTN